MAIKNIQVDGVDYAVKDETARNSIGDLSQLATEAKDDLVSALNELSAGAGSGSGPIQRIESLDESNLKNLRDLETGSYVLYGYFRPFAGAPNYLPFDNLLVNVYHVNEGSHLFEFSTANSEVNFIEILVDASAEGGHTYSRTAFNLLELNGLIDKVGNLAELATTEKSNLVAAINEAAASGGSGGSTIDQIIASVGQIARVKTIDENGNPTEWEAVAMPGVGIGGSTDRHNQNIKAINHRGYSAEAPENTLPAYILSVKKGFGYAEADVAFTSDNVAVLLHDSTIDRTSNGSGNIANLTYDQVSQYDFGSWKSAEYTGTKIPTFVEFIKLCKNICLHPYIEMKQSGEYTEAQIQSLVETVKACGMEGSVTWISFSSEYLGYVKAADSNARLGFLTSTDATESVVSTVQTLKSETNEVFLGVKYTVLTDNGIDRCVSAGVPLEVWTVNSEEDILALDPYITGVTSDSLVAGEVLMNSVIPEAERGTTSLPAYTAADYGKVLSPTANGLMWVSVAADLPSAEEVSF